MKHSEPPENGDLFSRLGQYDTIIDVRSPSEFAEDHIPGALNCPVLDDAERARVGTIYKQQSPFEAKKIGAALVAKNIAAHIEARFLDQPRNWKPLIYCWRGGNRSGSMTHILSKIGWHAEQLAGGYKTYRQQVNAALAEVPKHFRYAVICGTTGSGKSRLLQTLAGEGAQVLDLEQLAAHRGSVLGNLPSEPQPSQKMFESRILQTLRCFDRNKVVYVESESKKVGNLRVPEALMETMRASPCIALQLSRPNRVRLLMEDYDHFVREPAFLNEKLAILTQLHGKQKITHWQEQALAGQMDALVEALLVEHYDPLYLRSIDRNFTQFPQARELTLDGIAETDFIAAAKSLMAG
ncbi:MAG: ybbB [Burkholderiaceae bacterium]|nr:ybbB [Burkholderiaceae bacterium]